MKFSLVIPAFAALALLAAAAPAMASGSSPPKAKVDVNTRTYVATMYRCRLAVAAWTVVIGSESSTVQASSDTADTKAICDSAYATQTAAYGKDQGSSSQNVMSTIDACRSALADFSNYIDTQTPSKAVSAKKHLADCTSFATETLRQVNNTRVAYGLPRLTERGTTVPAAKLSTGECKQIRASIVKFNASIANYNAGRADHTASTADDLSVLFTTLAGKHLGSSLSTALATSADAWTGVKKAMAGDKSGVPAAMKREDRAGGVSTKSCAPFHLG